MTDEYPYKQLEITIGECIVKNLRLLVLCLLLLLSARCVSAQTENATITGRVTDPTKAVIVGAEVALINTGTNVRYESKTNGTGSYVVTTIPPGSYRVEVQRAGFKTIVETGVVLHTQDTVELNFEMALGAVSESVTINANAEHMETTNPAVGVLVDRDFVESMPLNGRSFQDLLALAPGAVDGQNGLYSINGQHDNANYFATDGVASNLNPHPGTAPTRGLAGTLPAQTALGTTQSLVPVDALQEFKIQTSTYTAEYGRQPGGQVELTTRSGTNAVHGSLFDYFRNDALDANSWFFNQNNIPKQAERQNDFGGTLGGPLVIPGLYNGKDKTFYFVSYEGLRLKLPQFSGVLNVPTPEFRQFAAAGVQPFLNSLPLPNGAVNGDQCALPQGFTFSCTAQWTAGFSNSNSLDSLNVRVDQMIGSSVRIFLRYANTPSESDVINASVASEVDNLALNTNSWTVGSSWTVRPNVVDEFRFNYSVSEGRLKSTPTTFGGAVPYSRSLVVPEQYAPAGASVQGTVSVSFPSLDFFGMPQYDQNISRQRQYNFIDTLAWTLGGHRVKLGGDYRRLLPLYNPEQYSSNFILQSLPEVQTGYASLALVIAGVKAFPVFNNLSIYGEDHWIISRRLSLDYGLRWEFNPAPGASNGVYPLALTTCNLATAQLAPSGTSQYGTSYHNFAPRFGFAYQAASWRNRPLVIRGGVGVFYDTGQSLAAGGYAAYPFSAQNFVSNVSLPAASAALAPPSLNFPLVPPYPSIFTISDPNLKLPYSEQWSVSLDQNLSPKNTISVSYVGNVGRRILFGEHFPNLRHVNPAFTSLTLVNNAASSSYNALQIQDQGFVAPGLQLVASYTWAHALDNASSDGSTFPPVRGNSNYDIRQVLNAALNYDVPGASGTRFLRALTRGWVVANRITAQSGYPLDVIQGSYFQSDGSNALIRPDLVPGVPIYLHDVTSVLGGWQLNRAAFSEVPIDPTTHAPVRQGTLGRNYVHGPNFWNLNSSLQRDFPLHEQISLIARIDAFNLLNHPNAGNISTDLRDGPSFGSSSGASQVLGVSNSLYATGAGRSLQVSLKLNF